MRGLFGDTAQERATNAAAVSAIAATIGIALTSAVFAYSVFSGEDVGNQARSLAAENATTVARLTVSMSEQTTTFRQQISEATASSEALAARVESLEEEIESLQRELEATLS